MDIKPFEKWLCICKGLQPVTIHGYCGSIMRLRERIDTDRPQRKQMEAFVHELYNSSYSYSHKINTVLAIEKYMEFIGKPINFGRQKKPKRIIKDTLTEGEVTKLLFNCKNIRESAILSLLAYSGIRNKELCNLKVSDIDCGTNTIRIIQGKGLKDRVVYMGGRCSSLLIRYMNEYEKTGEDLLFRTIRFKNPYRSQDLRKLLFVVKNRAKITKRVYPHLLRHSLATNMLNRGANLLTVKDQLGHAWIDSTMIYINSIGYGTRSDYERFSPSYL